MQPERRDLRAHVGHAVVEHDEDHRLTVVEHDEDHRLAFCLTCKQTLELPVIPRDPMIAVELTEIAGLRVGLPVDGLIELADRRAGAGSVRLLPFRRLDREALEEAADARNYVVWWMDQLGLLARILGEDEVPAEMCRALEHALDGAVALFHWAERARELQLEWIDAAR